jgi:hypothetical protein
MVDLQQAADGTIGGWKAALREWRADAMTKAGREITARGCE